MDGDDVQLIRVRNAHTDGDTMVKFVKADVIMSGDFYRQIGYPFPDRNNGGSVQGLIDGLKQLADAAGPNTKIVPGHGTVVRQGRRACASRHGDCRSRQGRRLWPGRGRPPTRSSRRSRRPTGTRRCRRAPRRPSASSARSSPKPPRGNRTTLPPDCAGQPVLRDGRADGSCARTEGPMLRHGPEENQPDRQPGCTPSQ